MNPNLLQNKPPPLNGHPTSIPATAAVNGNIQNSSVVDPYSYFFPQVMSDKIPFSSPPLPPGCDSFPSSFISAPAPLPNFPPLPPVINLNVPPPPLPGSLIQPPSNTSSPDPDAGSGKSTSPELSHSSTTTVVAVPNPNGKTNVPNEEKEKPSKLCRLYAGIVSSLTDDFGFLGKDNEIFFHISIMQGGVIVKKGDYVLVRCEYVDDMPLCNWKWNTKEIYLVDPSFKVDMIYLPVEANAKVPRVPPPAPVISTPVQSSKANGHSKLSPSRNQKRSSSRSHSYSHERRTKRKRLGAKWPRKNKISQGCRSRSSEERSSKKRRPNGSVKSSVSTGSSWSPRSRKTFSSESRRDKGSRERKRLILKKFTSPSRSHSKNGGRSPDGRSGEKPANSRDKSKENYCRSLRDKYEAKIGKQLPKKTKEIEGSSTHTPTLPKNGNSSTEKNGRSKSGSRSRPRKRSHSNKGVKSDIFKSQVSLGQKDKKAPIPIVIKTQNLCESKEKSSERSASTLSTKTDLMSEYKTDEQNSQEFRRICNEICPNQFRFIEAALAIINKPMPAIESPLLSLGTIPTAAAANDLVAKTEPVIESPDVVASKKDTPVIIKSTPRMKSVVKVVEPETISFKKFYIGKKTTTSPQALPMIQNRDKDVSKTEKLDESTETCTSPTNTDVSEDFLESLNSANRWKELAVKKENGQIKLQNSFSALYVPLKARYTEFQGKVTLRAPVQLSPPKGLASKANLNIPQVPNVAKIPDVNSSKKSNLEKAPEAKNRKLICEDMELELEAEMEIFNSNGNLKNGCQDEKVSTENGKKDKENPSRSPLISTVLIHVSDSELETSTDSSGKKKKIKKHSKDRSGSKRCYRTKKSKKESKKHKRKDTDRECMKNRESRSPSGSDHHRSSKELELDWSETDGYARAHKGWFQHDGSRVFHKDSNSSPNSDKTPYPLGRPPICKNCGLEGHCTWDCWEAPIAPPRQYNNRRLLCSICDAQGHLASMCPENQNVYKRSF